MAQQISSSMSVKAVRPQRNCSVTVSASKDWKKKAFAAALTLGVTLSVAAPVFAADQLPISEEELTRRIKLRVCNELPTNSICLPKKQDWYKVVVEPRLPK